MKVLIAMALLLLAGPLLAADWQPNREAAQRDQVATWTREVPGYSVKAFRGVVEVPQGPLAVMAVLTAVDTFPEWIFQAKGGHRLDKGVGEYIYMTFHGIWPVSDRDVVLKNSLSQDANGAITLHSREAAGEMPKQEGYVRIPELDNSFVVTALADGWTRVEFSTFVDPGGKVPGWLANLVSNKAPLDTLNGLKAQLQKPRFVNAGRDDLPDTPAFRALRFPND